MGQILIFGPSWVQKTIVPGKINVSPFKINLITIGLSKGHITS